MKKVYVVGVGMTKIDRHYDKGFADLIHEAFVKAYNDSKGAEPEAIVVGNMLSGSLYQQDSLAALAADAMGLRGVGGLKVEAACGSGGHAIVAGYSLVASGIYDVVTVVGVEKMADYPTSRVTIALAQAADAEHELIYGASFPALNALAMRFYMEVYGASREDLALWPVRMHEYAYYNPYAQLRNRITVDDVLRSTIIADPIRLMDSAPIGDGAAVVVLASEDIAKKYNDSPVQISGVGLGSDALDLSSRNDLLKPLSIVKAAEKAYRMAKVEPKNIDIAEIHDAFTITGLLCIEGLRFAEWGTSWKLIKEGRFARDDKPAINLSGGLKARGHPVGATGVYQVAEIAMQLRGDFPGLKASSPSTGLALNTGGVATLTSVAILRR
ncbi:MAG: thiolase domain-containing protein [Ignisphaera sp.]|uniref:Thiolase domain-containing protein n=1 Tax=Ignisphaera aggregans TaxID=334771 RepID=A0A7C4NLS0_9CREN